MLPDLSRLSLLVKATVDTDVKRKRGANAPVEPGNQGASPNDWLTVLPRELVEYVTSFPKGMPCKRIYELCSINRYFKKLCDDEEFWQYQCTKREYTRKSRVDWFKHVNDIVSDNVSWKQCYLWWCRHTLTNDTILAAVGAVLSQGEPYKHEVYGPIADWDVSEVTNMEGLFANRATFTGDLSQWDVSNVTNMKEMFLLATKFDSNLDEWNVRKVTSMQGMFQKAYTFKGSGLSGWVVSEVTNMANMFNAASNFNADLSEWDISKVLDRRDMFEGAKEYKPELGYDLGEIRMSRGQTSILDVLSFMRGSRAPPNADGRRRLRLE